MSRPDLPLAPIRQAELFGALPPPWPEDLRPAIQAALKGQNAKLVILDDDPTGSQSTHDVGVLTHWSVEALREELDDAARAIFILTNTRSMPLQQAQAINREVGQNLAAAAERSGRRVVLVSRGDSTLRGHFPGELEALSAGYKRPPDATILIPFFLEGGRYTAHDVHYAADGAADEAWLVPVAQTPFAQDSAFGYQHSNLRHWVEEKTRGRVRAGEVLSITLEDLRERGPTCVRETLLPLQGDAVCIVNALCTRDLEVFTLGSLEAEKAGKHFLYRTAASFIPVRAGIAPRPPLTADELADPGSSGGLIVVGSHVPLTTAQVNELQQEATIHAAEVQVAALLHDAQRADEIGRAVQLASRHLKAGEDVLLYTSREPVKAATAEDNLRLGQRISDALVEIVQALTTRPRYLLVKGGVTSSDIATKALSVKRAWATGQILPGVPLWTLGEASRYPGLRYVIFPGNVGDKDSLVEAYGKLRARTQTHER